MNPVMEDTPPPLPPPPLPPAGVALYATRNHAFMPACVWTLEGAKLRIQDTKGGDRVVPLAEVKEMGLDFAPTRPELNRFRCRLAFRDGGSLEFFNRTYAGVYDFRDTSAAYVAFVQALAAALVSHAPGCRFFSGATRASYLLSVLSTAGLFLCLGLISFFLLASGLSWLIAVKLLILIFYLPALVRWLARNRPRPLVPSSIPSGLLPATESTARPAAR